MRNAAGSPRGGPGLRRPGGAVAGYVFKLIRESLNLTQAAVAEEMRIDLATVQGWESGRRPLAALRTVYLLRLRARFVSLGAPLGPFGVLREAMEADLILADAIEAGQSLRPCGEHLLASHVHRRELTSLITWPFTGERRARLASLDSSTRARRRGPVSDRPVLGAEEQHRFFDHLQLTVDAGRAASQSLLRRQAIYLLGYDNRASTRAWIHDEQRRELAPVSASGVASGWVARRSAAVAAAHQGDLHPLEGFVGRELAGDREQNANLAYWAYWVGELPDAQTDDTFMTDRALEWSGAGLARHLMERLDSGSPHLELNVRTLWSLVLARPSAIQQMSPGSRSALRERLDQLLDGSELRSSIRTDATSVAYALRLGRG